MGNEASLEGGEGGLSGLQEGVAGDGKGGFIQIPAGMEADLSQLSEEERKQIAAVMSRAQGLPPGNTKEHPLQRHEINYFVKADVDTYHQPRQPGKPPTQGPAGISKSQTVDVFKTEKIPPGRSPSSISLLESRSKPEVKDEQKAAMMPSFLSEGNPLSAMSSVVNKFSLFGDSDEDEAAKKQKSSQQPPAKTPGQQPGKASQQPGPRAAQQQQGSPKPGKQQQGSPRPGAQPQAGAPSGPPQQGPGKPPTAQKGPTPPPGSGKPTPAGSGPQQPVASAAGPPQQGPPKPSAQQQGPTKPSAQQQGPPKPSAQQQGPPKPSAQQQGPPKPSAQQQGPPKPKGTAPGAEPAEKKSLCPLCKTTELLLHAPDKANYNTCTQCQTVVCSLCGFNPNPHITEVKEWLCLTCQMQRALGMDESAPPVAKPQPQLPKQPSAPGSPQRGKQPEPSKTPEAPAPSAPVKQQPTPDTHQVKPTAVSVAPQPQPQKPSAQVSEQPKPSQQENLQKQPGVQKATDQALPSAIAPGAKQPSQEPQMPKGSPGQPPAKTSQPAPAPPVQQAPKPQEQARRFSLNIGSTAETPKPQPTTPQETVTGKLFGFGSSFFSQASSLISTAVQPADQATPAQPVAAQTAPRETASAQASPKHGPAKKDTKPPVAQKPEQPLSGKGPAPGQEKKPAAVKEDKPRVETPKAAAGHTDPAQAPPLPPKSTQPSCPLCKVELNVGSKDAPNFNTCTECKNTVCNLCGFNPMPHLTEKEWLCLNCQTQRALAGQLGDMGKMPPPVPVSVKPAQPSPTPKTQPPPGKQPSLQKSTSQPFEPPMSKLAQDQQKDPQEPRLTSGPVVGKQDTVSTKELTRKPSMDKVPLQKPGNGVQALKKEDEKVKHQASKPKVATADPSPKSDTITKITGISGQLIQKAEESFLSLDASKKVEVSSAKALEDKPLSKPQEKKEMGEVGAGAQPLRKPTQVETVKEKPEKEEDRSDTSGSSQQKSPQGLSDTGYSSDGISSSLGEIPNLAPGEEKELLKEPTRKDKVAQESSPTSPSDLAKLESTVLSILEAQASTIEKAGQLKDHYNLYGDEEGNQHRTRTLPITPESYSSDEEDLADIQEEDEETLEEDAMGDAPLRKDSKKTQESKEGGSEDSQGSADEEDFIRKQIIEMSADEDASASDDDDYIRTQIKELSAEQKKEQEERRGKGKSISGKAKRLTKKSSTSHEDDPGRRHSWHEKEEKGYDETPESNTTATPYKEGSDKQNYEEEPELEMESLTDSPEDRSRGEGSSSLHASSFTPGTSPTSVSSLDEDSDSSPSHKKMSGESKQQRKARHRAHGQVLPTIEDSSEEEEMPQRRRERPKTPPSNLSPIEDASPTEELRQAAEMEELHKSSCSEYSPSIESEPEGFEINPEKILAVQKVYKLPTCVSLYSPTDEQHVSITKDMTDRSLKSADEVYEEMMKKAKMLQSRNETEEMSEKEPLYGEETSKSLVLEPEKKLRSPDEVYEEIMQKKKFLKENELCYSQPSSVPPVDQTADIRQQVPVTCTTSTSTSTVPIILTGPTSVVLKVQSAQGHVVISVLSLDSSTDVTPMMKEVSVSKPQETVRSQEVTEHVKQKEAVTSSALVTATRVVFESASKTPSLPSSLPSSFSSSASSVVVSVSPLSTVPTYTPVVSTTFSTAIPTTLSKFPPATSATPVPSKAFSLFKTPSQESADLPVMMPPPPPPPPPPPLPPPTLPKPSVYPKKKPSVSSPAITSSVAPVPVSSAVTIAQATITTTGPSTSLKNTVVNASKIPGPPPVPPKPASIPAGLMFSHKTVDGVKPPIAPKPVVSQPPLTTQGPGVTQARPVGPPSTTAMTLNLSFPAECKLASPTSPMSPYSNKSSPRYTNSLHETYVVITLPSEPSTPTESITTQAPISQALGSPAKQQMQTTTSLPMPFAQYTKSIESQEILGPDKYISSMSHVYSSISTSTQPPVSLSNVVAQVVTTEVQRTTVRQSFSSDSSGRQISAVQPTVVNLSTGSTSASTLAVVTESITIVTCTATITYSTAGERPLDLGYGMSMPLQLTTSKSFEPVAQITYRPLDSQATSTTSSEVPINLSFGTSTSTGTTKPVTIAPASITNGSINVSTSLDSVQVGAVDLSTAKPVRTMVTVDESTSQVVTAVIEDEEKPVDLTAGRRAVCCDVVYKLPFGRSCTSQQPATTLPEDRFGYRDDHYQYDRSGPYGIRSFGSMKPSMSDTNLAEAGLFLYKSKNSFDYRAGVAEGAVDLTSGRLSSGQYDKATDLSLKYEYHGFPHVLACACMLFRNVFASHLANSVTLKIVHACSFGFPFVDGMAFKDTCKKSIVCKGLRCVYERMITGEVMDYSSKSAGQYAETRQAMSGTGMTIPQYSQARITPTAGTHYGVNSVLRSSNGVVYSSVAAPVPTTFAITTQPGSIFSTTYKDLSGMHTSDTMPSLSTLQNQPLPRSYSFLTTTAAEGEGIINLETNALSATKEGLPAAENDAKQQQFQMERELLELEKLKQLRLAEELEWERQEIQRFREHEKLIQETFSQQQLQLEQIQQLQHQLQQQLEEQKIRQIYQYSYDPSGSVSPQTTSEQALLDSQYTELSDESRSFKKIVDSGVQTDDEDGVDRSYTGRRKRNKKSVDTSVQTDDEDQDDWDIPTRTRRRSRSSKYSEGSSETGKAKPLSKVSSIAIQTVAEISVQTEPVGTIKRPSVKAHMDAKAGQYLTSPQKDKKRPTPLEIGYSTHLKADSSLQVAPSPPKSPKVLYSPISPLSPSKSLEFVPYEKPIGDVSPQKMSSTETTKQPPPSPKTMKMMQRSMSDPKPLSPTADESTRTNFQYSDGYSTKGSQSGTPSGTQKKVKRTLPNPPPEEETAGGQSGYTTVGSVSRRRICRTNTMARAKILQDIDRELDLVERESSKLRKKQAELDEEEKEIDAKLRYLEMGINRRKEALLKEREKRERAYLQGVAEERDYMSDSEVSNIRGTRVESQHGLERPRTAPQSEFNQFIPPQTQPEPQYAQPTSPYTQYQYAPPSLPTQAPSQYTQQTHYQQQSLYHQPVSPYQTQSSYSSVPTLSYPQASQQQNYQHPSQMLLMQSKPRQTTLADLEPKITTNYEVIRNQPLMIVPSSTDSTYAVPHLGSKYSTLDLRIGLDERSSMASSPMSSISADSFYADIDHHAPRNYVLIDDIGELTKGTTGLSSTFSIPDKDLSKADRLLRAAEVRRSAEVTDFLGPLQTSSRLHTYGKAEEDSMEDPYELKLLKQQIKQEFRRGTEGLEHISGLPHYYHGDSSYRHFPKSEKYSISRLTLEKQAAKQLSSSVLYQKQTKHKKALIDPKITKFSPIQESRDLEPDYSSYLPSSTSAVGGLSSRARLLQDDITFGLRKNISEQQKYLGSTLGANLAQSLGQTLNLGPTMRSSLQDELDKPYPSGSRSRPSSRPSSVYGLDLSIKRDSSSSSLRLKTESEPLDVSYPSPSVRTKPSSLPISQSRGRIPIVAQNSEEESPLSPVGQPMGMTRASGGPLPPICADSRDQFGSSHSLPEVQQHMREDTRTRGYDRDIAFIMDDFQHAMSDSEAYHLRREETDWFDKPRDSRLENGHAVDRRLSDRTSHSRQSQHQQGETKPIQYSFPNIRVKLQKDPKDHSVSGSGLGIRIVGGKEIPGNTGDIGAYIAKVLPGGTAEQTGKIVEGMQALEWNGIPLTGKTYEEVQSIVSQPCGEAEICVRLDLNMLSDSENPQLLELHDQTNAGERQRSPGVDPKQLAAELQKVSQQQAPSTVMSATEKGPLTHSGTTSAASSAVPSPGQPGSPSVSKKRHSSKLFSESLSSKHAPPHSQPQNRPGLGFFMRYAFFKTKYISKFSSPPTEATKSQLHPITGELQLQVNYDKHLGHLILHVLQARNLAPRDNNGYSDPFVRVYLLPGRSQVMVVQNASAENKRRTKHVQKSLNPEWNQTVIYKNIHLEQLKKKTLELTVWDYDRFSSNDFLGEVLIDLSNTSNLDNTPKWYPLKEESESIDHGRSHSGQSNQASPKPSVIKSRSHGIFPDPSKDMQVPTIEKSHSSPGSSKSSSEGHLRSHGPSRSQSKTSVTQTHLEDAGAAIAAAEAAVQQLRLQPTVHKSGLASHAKKQHRHSITGVLPIQRTQSDNLPSPANESKDTSQLAIRKVMSEGTPKTEARSGHRVTESAASTASSMSSFGSGYSVDSEGSTTVGENNIFPVPRMGKAIPNGMDKTRGQDPLKQTPLGLGDAEEHLCLLIQSNTTHFGIKGNFVFVVLKREVKWLISSQSWSEINCKSIEVSGSLQKLYFKFLHLHFYVFPNITKLDWKMCLGYFCQTFFFHTGKTQVMGEIKIALKKEMKTEGEQLIVEILQCRNITYKFKSPDHLPDLYVKLYVINVATQKRVIKKKTRVCRHDREPSFNETFRFNMNPAGHSLQLFLVSNGGKFMKKTLIGEAYVWLDKVDLRKRSVNWHKLLVSSTQSHS
ncbi:PCLO protein, partial [Atractosteus spatula]|nr:PCLO protein [Atractosteus spatula]